MPSTYAHYLFGEKVAENLTGEIAAKIKKNKQLFYIGLHGPDILFYYKPLSKNPVNAFGYALHEREAAEFFKRTAHICRRTHHSDGAVAYMLGFVCHYALDKSCHGYIEKKIAVSGLAHSEIENEFDRFLIEGGGIDLKNIDMTKHIAATVENAGVIAPFFENVTAVQIKKALKSMKFYINFLSGNRVYKRVLVNGCLKLSGKYGKMKGVMMAKNPIAECEDSNKRLYKLFNKAVAEGAELVNSYYGYVKGINSALDKKFNYTFGAGENWESIPVFTVAEEDGYEV